MADEMVGPATMMDGNQNNNDNDENDEMIRIVKFMDRYPTMKRLFLVLEHKMNNNNNTDDSNNSNDSDSDDGADDVGDVVIPAYFRDDYDNDDDNRYLWLLQNEIDDTVNEFVGKMNTVVTEYEERFLPIFCGGNEEQRDNLPIPAGMRICRDNFIDVIDDSFDFSLGKSTMTVSKCLHHMDRKACTLLDKTWSHEVINVEDNRDFARGLDVAYDTEEEVQNMLRIFPDSINWWLDNLFDCELLLEPQSVTFFPVMLEACIDHRKDIDALIYMLTSDENDMGEEQNSIIQRLVMTPSDIEDKRLYDERCLTVLRRLKEMQLLRKEDVQEYVLLNKLCDKTSIRHRHNFFARQRFNFLVQLDPYGLINKPKREGVLEENLLLCECTSSYSSIEDFEIVFEAMIRYFPKMKGICTLFQAIICPNFSLKQSSPFIAACDVNNYNRSVNKHRYQRDEVMDVIEKVLVRNSALILNTEEQTQNCNDSLVLAMIDDRITLDGLFFLLRRSPDVLPNMMLQQNSNESSAASNKIRPKKKRRT